VARAGWSFCQHVGVLKIMLCGASDTSNLAMAFAEVTNGLGGEPWHYQTGQILYLNNASASWVVNSRRTVGAADLCVFVILERYGEITWNTELAMTLDAGKPFLILCLDTTYREYLALTRNVAVNAIDNPDKRHLVDTLREIEYERQLTIATFDFNPFKDVYRREAAKMFAEALDLLSQRSRRLMLMGLLRESARLTRADLDATEALAIDETEDKGPRKMAISALMTRHAASVETVVSLISSPEQGIQRFALAGLPSLYTQRPADADFFDDCVTLANESDDIGLARRIIPALFEIDVKLAVRSLENLDLSEIGARRRLAAALESHESQIQEEGLTLEAISMLTRCLVKSEDAGWMARCRSFIERLRGKQL
jgi:hypothetical protein